MPKVRRTAWLLGGLLTAFLALGARAALADTPPPAPDLAQRVADLEAYVTNGAPEGARLAPGPGHNAWMMTSAALVLFMTLPGLALFYGGLVRSKNVLSVHGAVPRLRRPGHDSLVGVRLQPGVRAGHALPRRPQVRLPQGRDLARPTPTTPPGSRRTCSRCTS